MSTGSLLERVDALEPVALHSRGFRYLAKGRDPRSGEGARIHGGRWNPPDSFTTLYLGLERDTVGRELARAAARQGLSVADLLPRWVYEYELTLAALLDLRDAEARAELELTDAQLTADPPTRCRALGEAGRYLGLEGVLAPSATGSGTVLALFIDRLQPGSEVRVAGREQWGEEE